MNGDRSGLRLALGFGMALIALVGLEFGVVRESGSQQGRAAVDRDTEAVGAVSWAVAVPGSKNDQVKGDGQFRMFRYVLDAELDRLLNAGLGAPVEFGTSKFAKDPTFLVGNIDVLDGGSIKRPRPRREEVALEGDLAGTTRIAVDASRSALVISRPPDQSIRNLHITK